MWLGLSLLALLALGPSPAWGGSWTDPGEVLGLAWGTSLDTTRERFPGGQVSRETPLTMTYTAPTHLDGILLSAAFQFVPEGGLQGVLLRVPVHRLAEVVGLFERRYGLAPIRGNRQWRWEGAGVRISIGEYPSLRTGGRRAVAWIRTGALEAAIARGDEAARAGVAVPREVHPSEAISPAGYEERLVRKIYWELRYPATTQGVYLVSLAFTLTRGGRLAGLELVVDPPNPEVAESVRAAVRRAQPFPPPPGGAQDRRLSLALTVTVFP